MPDLTREIMWERQELLRTDIEHLSEDIGYVRARLASLEKNLADLHEILTRQSVLIDNIEERCRQMQKRLGKAA
jgi:predicted  nucleic acid-binding Zn-ribbon protein